MTKDYVSRAGNKLEFALINFPFDVKNKVCADFGSSTGGFVDCFLRFGADKVYAVDTAYGELDWKIRNNPKVIVLERTNALHVTLLEKVALITIDTGWTKQIKIIPNALKNLKENGKIISLIKPQYETDQSSFDSKIVLENTLREITRLVGVRVEKIVESPILGERKKSVEYLGLFSRTK